MRRLFRNSSLYLIFALLFCGCAGNDFEAIKGAVTFQGSPLEQGTIQFYTLKDDEQIPTAGAMIRNGAYAVPRDSGLRPGVYLVKISSTERIDDPQDNMKPPTTRERIPAQYNTETKLTVEIGPTGRKQNDFHLQ
jgi:hypothetical protein